MHLNFVPAGVEHARTRRKELPNSVLRLAAITCLLGPLLRGPLRRRRVNPEETHGAEAAKLDRVPVCDSADYVLDRIGRNLKLCCGRAGSLGDRSFEVEAIWPFRVRISSNVFQRCAVELRPSEILVEVGAAEVGIVQQGILQVRPDQ